MYTYTFQSGLGAALLPSHQQRPRLLVPILLCGVFFAISAVSCDGFIPSPPAPYDVSARLVGGPGVSLSWSIPLSVQSIEIRILKSIEDSGFSPADSLSGDTRTWTDTDIVLDREYSYKIELISSAGSGTSDSVDISVPADFSSADVGNWSEAEMEGWTLFWNDEFDGTEVDTDSWTFETGAGGWGNNELQYYRQENTSIVADGERSVLRITAKEESHNGSDYTSSRLITEDKTTGTYGRIETRMKLPKGQGIWPAFWMLGNNFGTVGWPACGEIDIMELVGGTASGKSDSIVYGTLHWENASGGHSQSPTNEDHDYELASGTFADDYHVFGIEWSSSEILWYVDGVLFYSETISQSEKAEFRTSNTFFLLLNLAVGGNWPGNPDGTTQFPQHLYVDWIRWYQQS